MSERDRIFEKLKEAVDLGDEDLAEEWARKALEEGVPPYDAIILGLAEGMKIVGDKYEKKEYFLPDMLLSADAMYAGLNILTPHIPKDSTKSKGKIILGVVEGDVHDIGKNIVKVMLTASGYEVIDLGRDVPTPEFIEKAKSEGAHVIAMSTLMTPTLMSMQDVEESLDKEGMKDKVRTIIGGGSVSEEWRQRIGSDAYGKDATEAVSKIKTLIDNIIAAAESMKEENGTS
jgi:corrinoid protein of di/trimethylamine methyltransferase